MRILFLSQRFLLPMDTGGKIRTGKILEELSRTNEITLISNVELPKDEPFLGEVHRLCTKFISVPWREIRKYSIPFYARLFFQMFSVYPVSVLNDYSDSLRTAVEQQCSTGDYDVVICDFVQSALMFKNIKDNPTVLFQHNVESTIARRHVEQSENIGAKVFWWLQWKKMHSFEAGVSKNFDTVIAVSDKDAEAFRRLYHLDNVVTIPTGVDPNYFAPMDDVAVAENSLSFCGSMDWLPNEDAVIFFVKEILPIVKKEIPNVTLTVVGRNPSSSLKRLVDSHSEVRLTGWVEDTRPYIASSALLVVPIRIAGGTRMKIYEAMAMGKAVVSTSVGAEGLPLTSGENIIIEDAAVKFGIKIADLLKNRNRMQAIGTSARAFVRERFSWQTVAQVFSDICREAAHPS